MPRSHQRQPARRAERKGLHSGAARVRRLHQAEPERRDRAQYNRPRSRQSYISAHLHQRAQHDFCGRRHCLSGRPSARSRGMCARAGHSGYPRRGRLYRRERRGREGDEHRYRQRGCHPLRAAAFRHAVRSAERGQRGIPRRHIQRFGQYLHRRSVHHRHPEDHHQRRSARALLRILPYPARAGIHPRGVRRVFRAAALSAGEYGLRMQRQQQGNVLFGKSRSPQGRLFLFCPRTGGGSGKIPFFGGQRAKRFQKASFYGTIIA